MAKKSFLFLILLISFNINNIISFKYPINRDLLSSETGKQTSIEVSEKSDYDKYILNNNYVLAIFHADWCGHCKRFLPVINEASKYLKISKTWKLLKIPCTKYPNLCNSFSIEGYPTVKVYKNSQELRGISPPRDLENFLEFLIKISSEPIINITSQQEFYNNYGTFSPVIEYNNKNNKFISCINNLAKNEFLSEYYFGIMANSENKIIFNFEDNEIIFNYSEKKNNCDDVKNFLKNNKYPLISEASFNLMRKINKDNKKYVFIIFYNSNNNIFDDFIKKEFKNISKENRDIVFAYSYLNIKKDLGNYFQISLNKETEVQIFIYNFHKERFYKHELYDSNVNSISDIKDNIINLVKNINKIKYVSNNKFNDFISNNKILLISIAVILVFVMIYVICYLDIDDDSDEFNEKEDKEKARKEKKKLINNDFTEIKKENKENKENKEIKEDKKIQEEKNEITKEKID